MLSLILKFFLKKNSYTASFAYGLNYLFTYSFE